MFYKSFILLMTLLSSVSTNMLLASKDASQDKSEAVIDYSKILNNFKNEVISLQEKYQQLIEEQKFPEFLQEKWKQIFTTLGNVSDGSATLKNVLTELRNITSNGFYAVSEVYMAYADDSDELLGLLDDIWQCIWQARDVVEWRCFILEQNSEEWESIVSRGVKTMTALDPLQSRTIKKLAKQISAKQKQE